MPVSAVRFDRGIWFDNEDFTGETVELAPISIYGSDHADLYGGDHGGNPYELVARVVAVTGIADE